MDGFFMVYAAIGIVSLGFIIFMETPQGKRIFGFD